MAGTIDTFTLREGPRGTRRSSGESRGSRRQLDLLGGRSQLHTRDEDNAVAVDQHISIAAKSLQRDLQGDADGEQIIKIDGIVGEGGFGTVYRGEPFSVYFFCVPWCAESLTKSVASGAGESDSLHGRRYGRSSGFVLRKGVVPTCQSLLSSNPWLHNIP